MSIEVASARERADEGLAVARVVAVSTRKVRGRVAATVELVVTFRASGAAGEDLARRARDSALAYLDIA